MARESRSQDESPGLEAKVSSPDRPFLDDEGYIAFESGDHDNPLNWSKSRRWTISCAVLLLVANATLASSGPSAVLPSMSKELNITQEVAALSITLFLAAYAAGPLFWAPLSEWFGRRWIFVGSFLAYAAFNFLCAFTPNAAGLFIGRFISGFFASSTISNAPGLMVDIWTPADRVMPMTLFALTVFCGPALGPVISGFLEEKENWRWLFYTLLWSAAGTLPFLAAIRETFPAALLKRKAVQWRRQPGFESVQTKEEAEGRTLKGLFVNCLVRPWKILRDPILLCVTAYTSLTYGLLYILLGLYPLVFRERRGWNAGLAELPLLGIVVGAVLGGVGVFWKARRTIACVKNGHVPVPEDRLTLAMMGAPLLPIAMFWFSWTANFDSVPWIVPTLAGVPLSASFLWIAVGLLNYLADTYGKYTASAVAASAVCRTLSGAAAPLYTTYLFDRLTIGGGGSLIAGLGCVLAVVPFVFHRYGARIRARSKFARSVDADS